MTEQTKTKTAAKKNLQGLAAKPVTTKKPAAKTTAANKAVVKKTATPVAAKTKPALQTVKKVAATTQKNIAAKSAEKPTAKAAVKKAAGTIKEPGETTKAVPAKGRVKPTPEERYRMVETAAYFIAERNNFQGDPAGYWTTAEIEIAALLGK